MCELSAEGEVLVESRIATTEGGVRRYFQRDERMRVVLEMGASSRWVAAVLEELGQEVIVVNPRRVRLIAESTLKTDRTDAKVLAQLAMLEPSLLPTVHLRSEGAARARARLGVRACLVRARVAMTSSVHGTLRALGVPWRRCSPRMLVRRWGEATLSTEVRELLDPLVEMV